MFLPIIQQIQHHIIKKQLFQKRKNNQKQNISRSHIEI